jgi:hypothetical protein
VTEEERDFDFKLFRGCCIGVAALFAMMIPLAAYVGLEREKTAQKAMELGYEQVDGNWVKK